MWGKEARNGKGRRWETVMGKQGNGNGEKMVWKAEKSGDRTTIEGTRR